nr:MAG TPA: hypothetical protein [Caudoviricetes sp.]
MSDRRSSPIESLNCLYVPIEKRSKQEKRLGYSKYI